MTPITPQETLPGTKKVERKKIIAGSFEDLEREKEQQQNQINLYYKKMYDQVRLTVLTTEQLYLFLS